MRTSTSLLPGSSSRLVSRIVVRMNGRDFSKSPRPRSIWATWTSKFSVAEIRCSAFSAAAVVSERGSDCSRPVYPPAGRAIFWRLCATGTRSAARPSSSSSIVLMP
jgi:hypothetical protein